MSSVDWPARGIGGLGWPRLRLVGAEERRWPVQLTALVVLIRDLGEAEWRCGLAATLL